AGVRLRGADVAAAVRFVQALHARPSISVADRRLVQMGAVVLLAAGCAGIVDAGAGCRALTVARRLAFHARVALVVAHAAGARLGAVLVVQTRHARLRVFVAVRRRVGADRLAAFGGRSSAVAAQAAVAAAASSWRASAPARGAARLPTSARLTSAAR